MKQNRNSLRLVSHVAILVLTLILAVASTFSWYDRTVEANEDGNRLNFNHTAFVNNGETIDVKTYAGVLENGVVEYDDSEGKELDGTDVTIKSGKVNYFKTVLKDTGNQGNSLVSLYINEISSSSVTLNNIHIGLIAPEKVYKHHTATKTGANFALKNVCIEDNLFIKNKGTVTVYWFIEPDKGVVGDIVMNIGTSYVVAN